MKDGDLILVTDMQNVYTKGQPWACLDTEGASRRILGLCNKVEESDKAVDIAITKFMPPRDPYGTWKDYNILYKDINSNDWMNRLLPELETLAMRHQVYNKSVYSSMSIPMLRDAARWAGRVVLTGVVAECCVLFTAIDLIDMGCKLVYLTDACSGFTKEKEAATELVLKGLSPLHCLLMSTAEYEAE
ncbi:MAG: isochorismatase family protein [Treponema sp.]|nr:isochorismatase family protein [Treponema sp.]